MEPGDRDADDLDVADLAAIVDRWQARAWGDCDLDAVDEFIGDEYVRHGSGGTARRSREELKQDLRQYRRALGRPKITVHDRVVHGDKVWSRTTMRGANLESGESRTVQFLQIHRLFEGRIVEVWTLTASDVDW